MLNKIEHCLNNEVGGPNLENMIGIGCSLAVFVAMQKLTGIIFRWVSNLLIGATGVWNK